MRKGFTLLELLVATSIMAVAVVALLAALNTSLRNASRLTDHDRASIVARRRMEELLLAPRLPRFQLLEGRLTAATDAGLEGSWRARVTPFEVPPNVGPGSLILERVEFEIVWRDGGRERKYKLDAYRQKAITYQDMETGLVHQ